VRPTALKCLRLFPRERPDLLELDLPSHPDDRSRRIRSLRETSRHPNGASPLRRSSSPSARSSSGRIPRSAPMIADAGVPRTRPYGRRARAQRAGCSEENVVTAAWARTKVGVTGSGFSIAHGGLRRVNLLRMHGTGREANGERLTRVLTSSPGGTLWDALAADLRGERRPPPGRAGCSRASRMPQAPRRPPRPASAAAPVNRRNEGYRQVSTCRRPRVDDTEGPCRRARRLYKLHDQLSGDAAATAARSKGPMVKMFRAVLSQLGYDSLATWAGCREPEDSADGGH